METLLHICCAPCAIMCVQQLRNDGIESVGFWFNPNIHPLTEYLSRKSALANWTKSTNLALVQAGNYGLREFVTSVCPKFDDRCSYCYSSRLYASAEYAHEHGFTSFTTTLLISPYQNHDLLVKLGKDAAAKYSIQFLDYDFRPQFREGQKKARELGLYMQKYCGCIFSEEERYAKKEKANE